MPDDTIEWGLERIIDSWARGNIHTAMPGFVTEFTNGETPMVAVQPGFKRLYESADAPQNIPIIRDVPVLYPGSDDYLITFSIPVDTPVLLVFCERAIGNWMQAGGVVDPALDHMFDYSDAIAIPGLIPEPNALTQGVISNGIEIRNRKGDIYIKIEDETIEMSDGIGTVNIDGGVIKADNGSGDIEIKGSGQVAVNGTNLTVDP